METSSNIKVSWGHWLVIVVAVGVIGIWLWKTPSGVQGKADAVGYAICHRIEDRSFSAYDRQLPLCARCSGIYIGVMTGFGLILSTGRSRATRFPPWRVNLVLALFVVVLGIDGINSYFHLFPNFEGGLYSPNNTLRLITGVFCGFTLIHMLYPIFSATVWKNLQHQRVVGDLKELGLYCIAGVGVILLMLAGSPFITLILGLLGAIGVLLVLTMVNGVMFITLLRRENTYQHWSELWLPFLAGLTVAILLIGGVDALRFMFTGTWDGFVFANQGG